MLNEQKKLCKIYFIIKQIFKYYSSLNIYLLLIILIISSQCNAYNVSKCKYGTETYSLEWAFEPLTEHVVFVLSASIPANVKKNQTLFSGVGFSKQNSVSLFV